MSIRSFMLNSIQIQSLSSSILNTTPTINNYTTYIVTYVASSMKDVFLSLLHIIIHNLNIKWPPDRQSLSINWILNITTILKWWHLILLKFITFRFYLLIIIIFFFFVKTLILAIIIVCVRFCSYILVLHWTNLTY
jgi:hypothetical protein